MKEAARLEQRRCQLLVVDVQARLLPHIDASDQVVGQIARICRAARELELPIALTEQYPAGLGRTDERILQAAGGAPLLEKLTFSVWQEQAAREHLISADRPQVLLTGIEAHVCVQQTCFDLLEAQMVPFVLADAVGSRRGYDREVALGRMQRAGAVITTVEAAIFEMLDRCDTGLFKRILPIVK